MWIVYAVLIVAMVGVVAYLTIEPVKTFVNAIWQKWFKDSEVNFLSDLSTAAGSIVLVLDDPSVTDMLTSAGISPKWLIIFGIVMRLARMSRNKAMVPLTKE